jgi:molecular chaperone DnaJ
MTTAALGGDLEAPTIDGGKTRVKIPIGSQNNKQLRLKGKGMPLIPPLIEGIPFPLSLSCLLF